MPSRKNKLRIKAVEPTVLFVRGAEGLDHVVDVSIINTGPAAEASLSVQFGTQHVRVPVGRVPKGESTHAVNFPDIRQPVTVAIGLYVGDALHDQLDVPWKPQRHWHLYLVQRSHHDWGFTDLPSHVLEQHVTFLDDILDFCDETDDWPDDAKYRYLIEGAWSILEFLRNRDDAQIQRCAERLRDGRLELAALLGNQTSELCSHEELVRLLYPSFELQRRFGGPPIVSAELNDVPGLSWGLASVLAGAGVKYLSFGMPIWYFGGGEDKVHPLWDDEVVLPTRRPDAHWWEGPDGRRILLWHGEPGSCPDGGDAEGGFVNRLAVLEKNGYPFDAVKFPLSGGYTDNAPPTLRYCYIARDWNERYAFPRMIVSTDVMFYQHIERQLKPDTRTFRGEIPHTDYAVGATSTERETAINRLAHDDLATAEKFAAVASCVADYDYPAQRISEAYENMLLYDEHTWGMCHPFGPAQDAACGEKGYLALRAAALAHDVRVKSLNIIADQVTRTRDDSHLVVFNALDHDRTDVVRMPLVALRPCSQPLFWHRNENQPDRPPDCTTGHAIGRGLVDPPDDFEKGQYDLIDLQTGKAVPYQIVEIADPQAPVPFAAHRWAKGQARSSIRKDIVFIAADVPAVGYKTYRIVPRKGRKAARRTSIKVGAASIENRFFKVKLDPKTGGIVSIYDKQLKRELVDANARHQCNQLVVRTSMQSTEHPAKKSHIRKGHAGPVSASLIVTGDGLGCPQRTQEITLYENIKRIDFANRILKDSTPMLEVYFAFPFRVEQPTFQFEASGSVVEMLADQFPGSNTNTYTAQHYVDVSDGEAGITWSSREAHIVSLGGFWPLYVSFPHHGFTPPNFGQPFLKPGDPIDGHIYSCAVTSNYNVNFNPAQTGDLLFRYSITSHTGGRIDGGARDFGWAVGVPFEAVCVKGKHKGTLPARDSFAQVGPSNVMLVTIKRAEDGNGLIVRLMETDGVAADATVRLPFLDIAQAYTTNPVEENQAALRARPHEVTAPVAANGITTIRLIPR